MILFLEDEDQEETAVKQPHTPNKTNYVDMDAPEIPEADKYTDEMIDKYIGAELIFDVLASGNERRGRVMKRFRGLDGEPIGRPHTNPLFDTREYVVEFTDGTMDLYMANVIAENMYAQVDDEGNQYQLLSDISDHRRDATAIPIGEGFTKSKNGNGVPKKTT